MEGLAVRSNSEIVRSKIRVTCGDAQIAFEEFWSRPDMKDVLPAMMVLMHQISRATAPLLATAAKCADERAGTDPLCAALAPYYHKHAEEEAPHPDWHLNDLVAAGIPREAVTDAMPFPDVATLMGAQYYWIHHYHPVMLLGCVAVIEGNPPSMELVDRLEREGGLRPEAFRTYRFHGEVDPHHIQEFNEAVDGFPLDRRHLGQIGLSATFTANTLASCVRRIRPDDSPRISA